MTVTWYPIINIYYTKKLLQKQQNKSYIFVSFFAIYMLLYTS